MTLIDKAEALAPCPFCGGEAHYQVGFGVICNACGASIPSRGDDFAPWNRRAALAPTDAAQARSRCPYGATGDDCCGGYCNISLEDETPSLWSGDALVDKSTGEVLSLNPTFAAHVNETPKSEHDAGNVLTAAQARDHRLITAAKEARDIAIRHAALREAADLFQLHPWSWNAKEIRAKILALIGEKPANPQQAREAALEKEVLRLKARLWAIGHAAGIETKDDLMADALAAIGERPADPQRTREAAIQEALENKEQLDIWAQEILEGLGFADVLKIESYDDKIEAHSVIGRGIVEVLRSLIDKAEAHDDDLIRRGDIGPAVNKALAESRDIRDAIAALPARGVGVKPLVWEEDRNGVWTAKTIVGEYTVGFDDGWWCELAGPTYWDWVPPEDRRSYFGPAAAKAAAQADYEDRIMAALEPAPTAADAREAALKALQALREIAGMDLMGASAVAWNAAREVEALIGETRA